MYITKPDLNRVLPSTDYLDSITADENGDPDDTIWESAVNAAMADIRSGLNGRYDCANIFNQTGAAREAGDHAIVLQHTLSMAKWYIYNKVTPDKIPSAIEQECERIRLWLKGVAKFEINPDLPVKTLPQQDQILYGSIPQRQNPSL